jgi:hypothetical protein
MSIGHTQLMYTRSMGCQCHVHTQPAKHVQNIFALCNQNQSRHFTSMVQTSSCHQDRPHALTATQFAVHHTCTALYIKLYNTCNLPVMSSKPPCKHTMSILCISTCQYFASAQITIPRAAVAVTAHENLCRETFANMLVLWSLLKSER